MGNLPYRSQCTCPCHVMGGIHMTACCQPGSRMTLTNDAPVTVEHYTVSGQTSTEGRRWYIWGKGDSAHAIADELNRLAALASAPAEAKSKRDTAIEALRDYMTSAGVPLTEFDPEFSVRMMGAMMISFHKYGRVADAYPVKFDARSDVRARLRKYQETGNKHYLVDAANFAMIEAMHPARPDAMWGENSAADSPGRTTTDGHRLVQEANDGSRIMGETILHNPGDHA